MMRDRRNSVLTCTDPTFLQAAPLLMGNDLRNLAPEMKAILLAKEVIAVDQDVAGRQGWRVDQASCVASSYSCGKGRGTLREQRGRREVERERGRHKKKG